MEMDNQAINKSIKKNAVILAAQTTFIKVVCLMMFIYFVVEPTSLVLMLIFIAVTSYFAYMDFENYYLNNLDAHNVLSKRYGDEYWVTLNREISEKGVRNLVYERWFETKYFEATQQEVNRPK
jgi:hypothetical protein